MLHAAVLRSSHAHAHITSIDTAAARHVPGVVAVLTAEDCEGVVEPVPTRRETEAEELRPPVHPVLARDKVCYVGQPIAISGQKPQLRVGAQAGIDAVTIGGIERIMPRPVNRARRPLAACRAHRVSIIPPHASQR
jgi:CO/xanthine dehydrogenase Mo-binding subunit